MIDGATVGYGKAVKQVAYSEILSSGHHILHDQPNTMNYLFKSWVDSFSEERNISSE